MKLRNNLAAESLQRTLVRLVAALVFLNGLIAISRPLAERFPEQLEALLVPVGIEYFSRSLDLMLGLTLIYFSFQLLQRKQLAWWVALAASISILLSHITVSHVLLTMLLPALSLVALLTTRSYFRAKSEADNIRQGVLILCASLVFALVYGTFGFWFLHAKDFGIDFSLRESFERTIREYLLLGNGDITAHTRQARWFLQSLAYLGATSLGFGLFSLFRPIRHQYKTIPAERHHAEELLKRYGKSTEEFFKLWPHDKSYFLSSDGQAFLAYGVSVGMALVVGDPVGEPASVEKVCDEFRDYCLTKGWVMCFIYVSGSGLQRYDQLGLNTLKIGEDAMIDLEKFATETVRNKHFRNIQNRFNKADFTAELHHPPHSLELLYEVALVSREWARQPDRKEWRFLAGNYTNDYMQTGPLFVVRDADGIAQAFVNQIPSYINGEATIDLMRQRPDAAPNVMDFLFTSLLLKLHADGYRKFNLGLAPLSGLGEETNKIEERLLDLIYRANQRFISFQGLRRFKSKFEPEWEPKYIAYQGPATRLPKLAIALARIMRVK